MITTKKYIIKFTQINYIMLLITIYDKNGKIILSERMPINSFYDIGNALFYLIEENAYFDIQLPANNTQYGYILYGGISTSNAGAFHILLVRQNFTNKQDYTIANEFLDYYELKNIINDIGIFNDMR